MKVNCHACGKSIDCPRRRCARAKHVFCGRPCYFGWSRGPNSPAFTIGNQDRKCRQCGVAFQVPPWRLTLGAGAGSYCSKKCNAIAHSGSRSPHYISDLPVEVCGECGTNFRLRNRTCIGKRNYCSRECANAAHGKRMKGAANPHYSHGHGAEDYPAEFRKVAPSIRKRDGYSCRLCGKNRAQMRWVPDVHHIDYDKMNNDPMNLVSLCRECHGQAHGSKERRQHVQRLLLSLLSKSPLPIGSSMSKLLKTTTISQANGSSIIAAL